MSDVVEIKPETPVPPIAEVETEKTSSDNPTPDVTGDAETVAPPEGTFLGMGRADQYVVGFFVIASFALMAVHWAQLSGWGLQPIEIERQRALPLDYRIDINTATWVEWIQLPGIGEVLARRIVDDRDTNGTFKDVDDLQRVKGIGPKTVEKLRRWMTAGQTASDSDDGS
jgi:competence protein ComEA